MIVDENGNRVFKLIDYWSTITDRINNEIPNCPNYYNNPQRKKDPKTGNIILEDDEQRYKNEYF